jgi:hypothetical protein
MAKLLDFSGGRGVGTGSRLHGIPSKFYFKRIQVRLNILKTDRSSLPKSQPIGSPSSLFLAMSQSSRGLKYSRNALASILSCPVIALIASGQGFDDPIDSIALF